MRQQEIRYRCDYQKEWQQLIPSLRKYELEPVKFLSIPGDAPKDFITDSEYRPGYRSRRQRRESYIAKVGSKFYPNESITEHLSTRIGQTFGLNIADSKLRMIDGQVRFMSKYFLDRQSEQLTHGAEVFELCLGKENYKELADKKSEKDFFTFQMTAEAIKTAFPESHEKIMAGFVEMLAFDALIGHNDRHPYNWGVIVPIRAKSKPPRFSPVFDTARALFWNNPERRINQMLNNPAQLEAYLKACAPPVGWDGEEGVAFFPLMSLISKSSTRYSRLIQKFLDQTALENTFRLLEKEFKLLMSPERRELIKKCLKLRQEMLKDECQIADEMKGGTE
ncbi:MAG: HipA domain-containing protein [Candidatus Binatia bacterium]